MYQFFFYSILAFSPKDAQDFHDLSFNPVFKYTALEMFMPEKPFQEKVYNKNTKSNASEN